MLIWLDLQRFGGRGAGIGMVRGSADGTLEETTPRVIESIYRSASGWRSAYYKDEVLEAATDGNGNLTFSYAKPSEWRGPSAKTNLTNYITYEVAHGAHNGETFGINWDNVKSISGQTFSLKDEAKAHGLKWNRDKKRWER